MKPINVVRCYLLLILYSITFGIGRDKYIDNDYVDLILNLEAWSAYPWVVPIWSRLHKSLHSCLAKKITSKMAGAPSYFALGFLWAFKVGLVVFMNYYSNY